MQSRNVIDDQCFIFFNAVAQPLYEIGYKAANYLYLYLSGTLAELPGETLSTKLVIRNSTARLQ